MKRKTLIRLLLITYFLGFIDGACCSWIVRNSTNFVEKMTAINGWLKRWLVNQKTLVALLLTIGLFGFGNTIFAADQQQTVVLTVVVYNCENNSGHVVARLFSAQQAKSFGFEKDGALEQIGNIDNSDSSKVVFSNLPVGDYALSAFHDNNDSRKMETNLFGLYKKRFGFSCGATKPDFNLAKFALNRDQTIYITLR